MEGITMGERAIIFPGIILLFFFLPYALANTIINTNDDTWNSTSTQATAPVIVNQSVNHGTENMLVLSYGIDPNDMWAKMKYNLTTVQSHIITGLTWNYRVTGACSNLSQMRGYWSTSSAWQDDNTGNWNDSILAYNSTQIFLNTSLQYHSVNWLVNNSQFLTALYDNTNITYVAYERPGVGCTISGATYNISSLEGGNPAFLNFTTTDYLNGNMTATNPHDVYFDFETGTWNSTAMTGFDFYFDLDAGIIYPGNPGAFYYRYTTSSNASLGYTDCSNVGNFSTNQITNINSEQENGLYDTYCFNLTGDHNGNTFYGAIKIANYNTYCLLGDCHDLLMYWAMYSPSLNVFGYPYLNPNPAMQGMNATIQWTTTTSMYGNIKFRYNNSNTKNWTSWLYAFDNNLSYRQVHYTTINGQYVYPALYQLYLMGNDTAGNNYTSQLYEFYGQGSDIFTTATNESVVPAALDKLADSGFCSGRAECLYIVTGIMIAAITGASFFLGNKKFGILTLLSCIVIFGFLGWLPAYVVIPVLVLAVIPIVKLFRNILGGNG